MRVLKVLKTIGLIGIGVGIGTIAGMAAYKIAKEENESSNKSELDEFDNLSFDDFNDSDLFGDRDSSFCSSFGQAPGFGQIPFNDNPWGKTSPFGQPVQHSFKRPQGFVSPYPTSPDDANLKFRNCLNKAKDKEIDYKRYKKCPLFDY